MNKTRPSGALPIYLQISEMLIRDIAAGRLRDGMRLPPERVHCAELGISIGTLRKALNVLEEKGLLTRVQGSGNYIRSQEEIASIYSMLRLELHGGGGLPTAELLSVALADKPADAPAFGPSAQGWRFRRLRFLNGLPAALEEVWIDKHHARNIKAEDVSESLYLFYREKLNIQVVSAEDLVATEIVPDWADPSFGPKPGDVCGFVTRLGLDGQGQAIEFSKTWFDSNRAHYVSRLGKS